MKKTLLFAFIASSLVGVGQSRKISGHVVDKNTQSGIPFATVHIEGTSIGTCTNLEGKFQLKLPLEYPEEMLLVSSMGYESALLNVREVINESVSVQLEPSLIELETVVVRPITEVDYILRAVGKFERNYAKDFSSNIYFRQYGSDNGNLIQFSEGYMQVHFEDFLNDTSEISQRLLLYDATDQLDAMEFRKMKREKKLEKAKRKAAKQQIALDEDSVKSKAGKVGIGLISPDLMMDQDPVRQVEFFLDSSHLKHFEYQFENDLTYQGRRVTVISFKSRNKSKLINIGLKGHVSGTIFFDQESDAIIGLDYDSEMVIPIAVKPLLFLAGFSASNPVMKNKVRYLQVGDRWFPQSIQIEMGLDLTQRYMFKKNERSSIDLELLMAVSNIKETNPDLIEQEFKFDRKKEFEEQVYPLADSSWDIVSRIALETIK